MIVAAALISVIRSPHAAGNCIRPVELLPPPARLFHGTSREELSARARGAGAWQFPPGPAWFATERDFSLHAPLRYPGTTGVTLLTYRPSRPLELLHCDSAEEAADHAVRRGLATNLRNSDGDVARTICAVRTRPRLDGYRILADRVRGEVEYIICDPPRVLDLVEARFWEVKERWLSRRRGRAALRGLNGVWLDPADLGCFVELPQQSRTANCPDHGTLPHVRCCRDPRTPGR